MSEEITEKLKRMEIHEVMCIDNENSVMRVPNGLVYITTVRTGGQPCGVSMRKSITSVFVPLYMTGTE